MRKFVLEDQGGGHFLLRGKMTFRYVGPILRVSMELFHEHPRIEVDLSGVTETDSAGLALLLEWITWANHNVHEIQFLNTPEKIDAIAKTTEVDHLLKRGERWAGFIQAPTS
ncbi:MAG: STAS domain-containing protein [Gammaproteobacteria bacterium]|nr:STAS domain-containing protein [Gammaproteobacteria bacterium]MCZ6912548.1 STAS domain-containing protein [Pseudomonadota bacterium]